LKEKNLNVMLREVSKEKKKRKYIERIRKFFDEYRKVFECR